MANELALALDDDAKFHGGFSKPGSRYRHARNSTGEEVA